MLAITHDGGDELEAQRLSLSGITDNSNTEWAADTSNDPQYTTGDSVNAGSRLDVWVSSDDTVRVVWTAESGDTTGTLAKWEGPDA